MAKYQKYVNATFLVCAALVWLVSGHYLGVAMNYFQLGRKFGGGVEVIQHALPVLFAIITFWLLKTKPVTANFTHDAVEELSRVSWPSAKDVRLGTIVVITTVIIAGFFFGLLDLGFGTLVRRIVGA